MRAIPVLCRHRCSYRNGFTMLESVIAVMLVGLLMTAALNSVGAAKRREVRTIDEVRGQQLAAALLNEILRQAYSEPNGGAVFGPEPGETGVNRALFDDVDDYLGLVGSPPVDRSGIPVPGYTGWTRSVDVQWINPANMAVTTAANSGLKRMTVTVTKGGKTIATATGFRSIAWIDTIPAPADATSNHAPIAVATSTGLNRQVNQTVAFSATSSTDPDGNSLSYVWNFGNGTTATGASVTTTYSVAGSYTCTLTVYDGQGGVATAALTAVISP